MYTTVVLFALTGFSPAAETLAPSWLTDYGQARKQGVTEKKPVAIFVGTGQDGWQKLVRGGAVAPDQKEMLATNYVCVYADLATEEGKRLARTLDVNTKQGLVISDHSGQVMALHYEGDLEGKALTGYLQKFSDSQRTVAKTETNPALENRSYYGPTTTAPAAQPAYRPVTYGRSC